MRTTTRIHFTAWGECQKDADNPGGWESPAYAVLTGRDINGCRAIARAIASKNGLDFRCIQSHGTIRRHGKLYERHYSMKLGRRSRYHDVELDTWLDGISPWYQIWFAISVMEE